MTTKPLRKCRTWVSCTLWTDFTLAGERQTATAMSEAAGKMNDYHHIRIGIESSRRAMPADTARVHSDHRAWLKAKLSEPFDGDTIIATHHAPHPDCLPSPLSGIHPAYASDLTTLIKTHEPAAWIYGHTHTPRDITVGRTQLRNVSLGYPRQVPDTDVVSRLLQGFVESGGGWSRLTSRFGPSAESLRKRNPRDMAERVILIDFEASGLGPASWPIEVGLAWLEGNEVRSWSSLIRPHEAWDPGEWSDVSADVHNIPRGALDDAPDALAVAEELRVRTRWYALASDAPAFGSGSDACWIS